jgi:L-iditol 2-dehydrogenase
MLEIDPAQAFAYPAHVSAECAALNEPVACCLRSVEQAKPKPGDLVSVFGCGTMGRLHTALLLQRGCRVIMVDDDGLSRSAAAQIGGLAAEPVAMRDAPMLIRRLSDVDGAQTAFCTRGGAAAASMAIETSARGGRVILFQSLQADRDVRLDLNDLHYREITVTGTIAQSAKDFAAARTLLAHDTAIRDALTIETVPATEANRAFARSLALDVNRVMIDFR